MDWSESTPEVLEKEIKDALGLFSAVMSPIPDLREYYYYLRTFDNKPSVTICIAFNDKTGESYRGIAICSEKENAHKITGKLIAKKNVLRAKKIKGCEAEIILSFALNVLSDAYQLLSEDKKDFYMPLGASSFDFKIEYNPELTPYELKLKKGKKNG